jgi:hypothetical protein
MSVPLEELRALLREIVGHDLTRLLENLNAGGVGGPLLLNRAQFAEHLGSV